MECSRAQQSHRTGSRYERGVYYYVFGIKYALEHFSTFEFLLFALVFVMIMTLSSFILVGIRCRYCARLPTWSRARGAVYYSATLDGLYQAVSNSTTAITDRNALCYCSCETYVTESFLLMVLVHFLFAGTKHGKESPMQALSSHPRRYKGSTDEFARL
jgi:hypothetical protein